GLAQHLERGQQMEHGAVVDGQGRRVVLVPVAAGTTTLEERIAVRVEEAAPVGRQPKRLVLDAAVDRAKEREQPMPRGRGALERILAVAGRALLELLAKRRGRVTLGVERV